MRRGSRIAVCACAGTGIFQAAWMPLPARVPLAAAPPVCSNGRARNCMCCAVLYLR